jgi:uncharacterized protein (UPF0335 family)
MIEEPWKSDDLKVRLSWWAFKFCGKGQREDLASDEMSAAIDRIEKLETALKEILNELSDKDAPSWLGHGVMAMIATNALEGKKAND